MIDDDGGVFLIESWDEAAEFKRWLGERRPVLACDTETSGFDWWRGDLRLVQFGDARTGWSIPWDEWRGMVKEVLRDYEGDLVFHNAKFDLHWLMQNGCEVSTRFVHDTAVQSKLLDPLARADLKGVAQRRIDPRSGAGQSELKKAMTRAKWDWGSLPVDFVGYWAYGALDTVLTAHLHENMHPQISSEYRYVYDLEMANIDILRRVEERGMRIDLDYCAQQEVKFATYAEEAKEWLKTTYDCAATGKSLATALQREGITLTKQTDSGGWSTDKDVLEAIDHPLATTALAVRSAQKLAKSYFGKYLELADGDIVHPGINPMGAKTGRMSISDPSMQNLPRGRRVRDAVIAREGHTLFGIDYEQIEMRLMTHLCQDPGLITAFESGIDFFMSMAQQIYHDPSITKDDPRRQVTKSTMYAKAFGAGVRKFSQTAGISEAEGKVFNTMLESTFPGMPQFAQRIQREAVARKVAGGNPYVKTQFGRRLEVEYADQAYKLVNALIQGTAADILKNVIWELDQAGLTQFLVLPVHDELIFDIPDAELNEVVHAVAEVMQRDEYTIPLTVDGHTGQRWGELKG